MKGLIPVKVSTTEYNKVSSIKLWLNCVLFKENMEKIIKSMKRRERLREGESNEVI